MILLGHGPRVSRLLLKIRCFGVTPIAFWIRENSRIHEQSPFETALYSYIFFIASLLVSQTQPSRLFSSETAPERKIF